MAANDPDRGQRIADAMKRLGYGPVALGKEIGARRETVYRWTKGGPIDPELLGKLAAALEMTRGEIMGPGPEALEDASASLREATERHEGTGGAKGS